MTPGSIVRCRNRDWVLMPETSDDVYLLRPLTGATNDVVAVHKQLANLVGYDLPEERVRSATFPLPSPDDLADASSAHLLWQAARLTLREGATPGFALSVAARWTQNLSVRSIADGIASRSYSHSHRGRRRCRQDYRSPSDRS